MKKILTSSLSLVVVSAAMAGVFLPTAQAAVSLTSGPSSLATTASTAQSNSAPIALFTFTLNNTAGENLNSVTVEVDSRSSTTPVVATHLASLSLYKDNGSGIFNPATSNLIGTQNNVNIGTPTSITPSTPTAANGKFYISIATSLFWYTGNPADSITATLPSNAIATSAGSLATAAITTAPITGGSSLGPQLISALLQSSNTFGNAATLTLTFSKATNKYGVSSNNISNQLVINNGHSFLDSSGNLGNMFPAWSSDGTILTIGLNAPPAYSSNTSTYASLIPGDTISMASATAITDLSGNVATGSVTVSGASGINAGTGSSTPVSITAMLSANNVGINTPVYDRATLSFSNSATPPSGTIVYTVYPNAQCTGSPLMTDNENVSNGTVPASKSFVTTATGTYGWQANFSANNVSNSATGACQPEFVINANAALNQNPSSSSGTTSSAATSPSTRVTVGTNSSSLPTTGIPINLVVIAAAGTLVLLTKRLEANRKRT